MNGQDQRALVDVDDPQVRNMLTRVIDSAWRAGATGESAGGLTGHVDAAVEALRTRAVSS